MSDPNVPSNGAPVNPSADEPGEGTNAPAPGNAPKKGRPKKKKATIDKRWADLLLADTTKPWYAEANHTSSGVCVYRWNGSYLQLIGGEEGSAMAAEWLDRVAPDEACDAKSNSAWKFGAKRLRTDRPLPSQDMRRNLIPCADVYLEILRDECTRETTIKAVKPCPLLGMTYAVNLNAGTSVGERHTIKPLPATSLFRQFIEKALPDPEVRALVQEQCGLTLLPANYQIAAWWVGAAGSGKSTLTEICKAMQRQVASTTLDQLGATFGLENLIGASLVQVDEVEAEKWAEGKFKSLVSGNGVPVNRKHEKALANYSLRAKWIITSNDKPFVRDKSDGVWRRLCIVPFTIVIPEEERKADYHLELLEKEGAQILDWMLEGAQRVVSRGRFLAEHERPDAVRDLKEESRNDCDSVRAWTKIFNVRVETKGFFKSKEEVYEQYEQWCLAAHEEPLARRVFWKALRARLPGVDHRNKRIEGGQAYYCNLAWTMPQPVLVYSKAEPAKTPAMPEAPSNVPATQEDTRKEVPEELRPEVEPAVGDQAAMQPDWNVFLEGPDPFLKTA